MKTSVDVVPLFCACVTIKKLKSLMLPHSVQEEDTLLPTIELIILLRAQLDEAAQVHHLDVDTCSQNSLFSLEAVNTGRSIMQLCEALRYPPPPHSISTPASIPGYGVTLIKMHFTR